MKTVNISNSSSKIINAITKSSNGLSEHGIANQMITLGEDTLTITIKPHSGNVLIANFNDGTFVINNKLNFILRFHENTNNVDVNVEMVSVNDEYIGSSNDNGIWAEVTKRVCAAWFIYDDSNDNYEYKGFLHFLGNITVDVNDNYGF